MTQLRPVFPAFPDWTWMTTVFGGSPLLVLDATLEEVAARVAGRLCYLATPYTAQVRDGQGGWDLLRSDQAGAQAAFWAGACAKTGIVAVAPVALASAMVAAHGGQGLDPLDAEFWAEWCEPLLRASEAVIVPPLLGWRESHGIWREAGQAVRSGKPVFVLSAWAAVGPMPARGEAERPAPHPLLHTGLDLVTEPGEDLEARP